jgi:hypothetical protein
MNQALYAHMNNKRKMKKKKVQMELENHHLSVITEITDSDQNHQ